MARGLRSLGHAFVSLVVAFMAAGIFWVVIERFADTPIRSNAVAALLGITSYVVFGLTGAAAYTVLNEGPRALRIVLPKRLQVRRR